jgi:hypothetical protein
MNVVQRITDFGGDVEAADQGRSRFALQILASSLRFPGWAAPVLSEQILFLNCRCIEET